MTLAADVSPHERPGGPLSVLPVEGLAALARSDADSVRQMRFRLPSGEPD